MVDVHKLHFRNKSPLIPRSPDFEVREGFLYAGTVVNSCKDSPALMNVALKVVLLRSMSSSSEGASRTLRQATPSIVLPYKPKLNTRALL